jgi:hypothetical protein
LFLTVARLCFHSPQFSTKVAIPWNEVISLHRDGGTTIHVFSASAEEVLLRELPAVS